MKILTDDKSFYKTLFHLMSVVVLQNVVAFSVNMADNIMLGAYSQAALSGAAAVNQIQFMVQQITLAVGDSVVVLGSQFWGQKDTSTVRQLSGIALIFGLIFGISVFIWTTADPAGILMLFTDNDSYIAEGMSYLRLIRFTYPLYVITTILMSSLRSVEIVNISLKISVISLITDVAVNYVFIFGKFGMLELGSSGAAIGTLTARILELLTVLYYMLKHDGRLKLFSENPFSFSKRLFRKYVRVLIPSLVSNIVWSIATPIQTGILGRLSSDAIAANSVSTTMFQYLKVVTVGEASASSVVVGTSVGAGSSDEKIKEYSRTLQIIYIFIGVTLAAALFFLRIPFLKLYNLTPDALKLSNQIIMLLCVIMIGMAYQMPACMGIIKGGGDVKYTMYLNMISTWLIVMPLSFAGAFLWKLPVVWVVALLNSDQIFKCIPVAIHTNRYKWIKRLTK